MSQWEYGEAAEQVARQGDIEAAIAELRHDYNDLYEAFRIMRGHAYKQLERRICDLERDVGKLCAGKTGASRVPVKVAGN